MSTAVIYQSKYGAIETYAKWLAEDLGADLLTADKVKPADLQKYSTLIYGGGIYVGSVSGITLLANHCEGIKNKSLYLFTVGASDVTDPETPKAIRKALERKLPPVLWEKIHIYHLRGGMQYSKMNFIHRTMMNMMVNMLRKKNKNELLPYEKYMLETHGQDILVTDRTSIAPMMADIKAAAKAQ